MKKAAAASSKTTRRTAATRTRAEKKSQGGRVSIRGTVSSENRHRMIAVAAFLRAEQRQFKNGDAVTDWLAAEKEVDRLLEGT